MWYSRMKYKLTHIYGLSLLASASMVLVICFWFGSLCWSKCVWDVRFLKFLNVRGKWWWNNSSFLFQSFECSEISEYLSAFIADSQYWISNIQPLCILCFITGFTFLHRTAGMFQQFSIIFLLLVRQQMYVSICLSLPSNPNSPSYRMIWPICLLLHKEAGRNCVTQLKFYTYNKLSFILLHVSEWVSEYVC